MSARLRGTRGDAGPLELVILVPVVLLVFGLVVAFGRATTAQQHVQHAAAVGARAAAAAQTAGGGTNAAARVVRDSLAGVGMTQCGAPSVSGTWTPGGRVTVTVSCVVDLGDVTRLGVIPGSRTLTASATEVIDRTRGGAAG
jgi:Flp pilus assembly protein TadG